MSVGAAQAVKILNATMRAVTAFDDLAATAAATGSPSTWKFGLAKAISADGTITDELSGSGYGRKDVTFGGAVQASKTISNIDPGSGTPVFTNSSQTPWEAADYCFLAVDASTTVAKYFMPFSDVGLPNGLVVNPNQPVGFPAGSIVRAVS